MAKTTRWRKKPVEIEAIEYRPERINDVWEWAGAGVIYGPADGNDSAYVETLEGRMEARPGDWIIKGVKGEFYPCKPDIFEATYEPADVSPEPTGGEAPDAREHARLLEQWRAACGVADQLSATAVLLAQQIASRASMIQHKPSATEPAVWRASVLGWDVRGAGPTQDAARDRLAAKILDAARAAVPAPAPTGGREGCEHRIDDGTNEGAECPGEPVERLAHVNDRIDWTQDGTRVCARHLAEHQAESLLTGGREARELWVGFPLDAGPSLPVVLTPQNVEGVRASSDWEVRRFREVLSGTDGPND